MKNILKNFLLIFALAISLLIVSCQTEETVIQNNIPENLSVKKVSLKDMPFLKSELQKIKEEKRKLVNGVALKTIDDFVVDEEKILVVEKPNYTSYTFIVENNIPEGQPYYVENLIVETTLGGIYAYTTKYIPNDGKEFYRIQNFEGTSKSETLLGDPINTFPIDTTPVSNYQIAFTIGCWDYVVGNLGEGWYVMSATNHCGGGGNSGGSNSGGSNSGGSNSGGSNSGGSNSGGSNSGGANSNGDNPPHSGGGSGGSSYGNGGSGSSTAPNIPTEDEVLRKKYKSFLDGLSTSQYQYLASHSNTNTQIFNYLEEHFFTYNAKQFAKQLIEQSIVSGLTFDVEKSSKSPVNIDVTTIDKNTPEGQKFDCIYTKLMQSQTFKNLFLETFGNNNRLNVKFEIAETLSSPNAVGICQISIIQNSSGTFYNNLIKIKRDILQSTNGIGNRSNVFIANTIIHELIHAYLNIKKINCNLGSSLTEINNMELGELIQSFYNNFNCAIDVDGSPQSQHDFMYNFMNSTFVTIFNEVKSLMISQNHINYAEQLVFQDSTLGINENWNWNKFFKYLALNGLHQCDSFVETTQNNPIENYLYLHYGPYANSFTKDCN